jgi:hypothetical protein
MRDAFSSREVLSPIKVIISNEEPFMGVELFLRAEPHLHVSLAAVS